MTIASLVFAHTIGNWVDQYPRLWIARWALFVQKVSVLPASSHSTTLTSEPLQLAQIAEYSIFLVLFAKERQHLLPSGGQVVARLLSGRPLTTDIDAHSSFTLLELVLLFGLITFATMGRLSTTVIDIAVDRDWRVSWSS